MRGVRVGETLRVSVRVGVRVRLALARTVALVLAQRGRERKRDLMPQRRIDTWTQTHRHTERDRHTDTLTH
eukprot:3941308-Rhodomonas_salina.2